MEFCFFVNFFFSAKEKYGLDDSDLRDMQWTVSGVLLDSDALLQTERIQKSTLTLKWLQNDPVKRQQFQDVESLEKTHEEGILLHC